MVVANQIIRIVLTDEVHALCFPKHVDLFVGDTVQFVPVPENLGFRVEIDGSPFSDKPALVITDQNPRTLQTPGHFFWKCFLTREDGVEVGWFFGEDPESGGDPDVRPRPPGM